MRRHHEQRASTAGWATAAMAGSHRPTLRRDPLGEQNSAAVTSVELGEVVERRARSRARSGPDRDQACCRSRRASSSRSCRERARPDAERAEAAVASLPSKQPGANRAGVEAEDGPVQARIARRPTLVMIAEQGRHRRGRAA